MLKGIPIAIEDFKKIIETNCYYIDKTKFIEDILVDRAEVKLFCRPRRFGKTLNISTLRYFFDIENKEKNRKLFNGLYIESSPMIKEQGKYPVIFLSMKGITGNTWKDSFSEIKVKIKELFKDFTYLVESLDKYEKVDFEKYILEINNLGEADLKKSLHILTKLLYKYYNQKVVVLIDEYDSPMAIAIKDKKKPKLSEYTINEYDTFQEALQAFQRIFSIYDDRKLLSFRYINEKEIIGRLSTSKKSLSPKVKKNLLTGKYFLSFKRAECKYLCSRDYSEIGLDYGYGSHRKSYIVMETNYKKVAQEYEKYMERFEDKYNTYYMEDNIDD